MPKVEIKASFIALCLAVVFTCPSTFAADLFPTFPEIEKAVQFWTSIYSVYSKNDVVLHDLDHLQVVYGVVHLQGGDDVISTSSWRKIKEEKTKYTAILRRLAALPQPIQTSALDDKELAVYMLWQGVDDPFKYSKAIGNIRSQQGLKEDFMASLRRSGRFMNEILVILQNYNVPAELAYLPHVESSFNYKAFSRMGAAGIWQFTRRTGRLFMTINYTIDERWDPLTATEAAARLLAQNYRELGAWPLAITAYNHGLAGMKRAKARHGTTDLGVIVQKYQSRSFGFASKNFYAEFLAAKHVAENYLDYFGQIDFEQPIKYQVFEVPDYVTIDALARKFNIDRQDIASYNPALRLPIVNSSRRIPKGFQLKLPVQEGMDASALYASLPVDEKHEQQVQDRYYRVEAGDKLGDLARRFGTSIEVLMTLNDISNPHRIHEGQVLALPGDALVPQPGAENVQAAEILAAVSQEIQSMTSAKEATAANVTTPPTLLPGTELQEVLAEETDEASAEMLVANSLIGPQVPDGFFASSASFSGQAVRDTSWYFEVDFKEPTTSYIIVQPEETLGHFAEWLGVSASYLRNLNNIYQGRQIRIGQQLHVSFHQVSRAEFHQKRLEYHKSVQEDFFNNFRVMLVKPYVIRNGDTVWKIANQEFQLPLWLLKRYNKEKELLNLHRGEEINIPVVVPRKRLPLRVDYVG